MKFFTEAVIPPDSNLIGREVTGVQLFKREGVRLIDVIRGDLSLRRNLKGVQLQVGDRVVLRTQMTELLSLQRNKSLKRVDQVSAVETTTVEVLITPGCRMVGRTLGSMRLRRRFGVYPLAGAPAGTRISGGNWTIWWCGWAIPCCWRARPRTFSACRARWTSWMSRNLRRGRSGGGHAPLAVAALAGIVALAAFGVAPILALAVVAVAVVLGDALHRRGRGVFLYRRAVAGPDFRHAGDWCGPGGVRARCA